MMQPLRNNTAGRQIHPDEGRSKPAKMGEDLYKAVISTGWGLFEEAYKIEVALP